MNSYSPIQRAVSGLLLTTFTSMAISPAAVLAQTAAAAALVPLSTRDTGNPNAGLLPLTPRGILPVTAPGSSKPVAAGTPDAALWTQLQNLSEQAAQAGNQSTSLAPVLEGLRGQYRKLQAQETQALREMAQWDDHIKRNALPSEIAQRQQAFVQQYQARSTQLRTAMKAIDDAASGKGNAKDAVNGLLNLTRQFPAASFTQANGLAWGHNGNHGPARALQRSLAPASSTPSLASPVFADAPGAGDLAETEDTSQTPEIRTLASQLDNNPVKIANWVRNNISYTVGYGSMQGAASTLQARHGNATDSASLLIALLRAAKVPARYVVGNIEVPQARLQTWLGVDQIESAQRLLSQAGINSQAVAGNGAAHALRFDHVWVQAWVDNTPSRGAINKAANTWVPMDPSFKLSQASSGLDLRSSLSLNPAAVFDSAKQGASCSADGSTHLNGPGVLAASVDYQTRLANLVGQQGADITVGSVLGQQTIGAENYGILLGSLPYTMVAQKSVWQTLPDAMRWQFRYQLFADSAAQSQNQPTVLLSGSWARLGSQRLTLSFAPASDADAQTLASFMPRAHSDNSPVLASEFPASLPGYLIRVKAELRADGALVASGGNFVLGSALLAETASFDPTTGTWQSEQNTAHAGDYQALLLDAQGISAAQLAQSQARLNATESKLAASQYGSLLRDDTSGDLLHATALNYFAQIDANASLLQRSSGVLEQRLPSWGRAVAAAVPQTYLGLINKVSFPGIQLEIDRLNHALTSSANGSGQNAYAQQSHQRNASGAHQMLNRLYGADSPAVSAARQLGEAASQSQTVFGISSANIASVLPQVNLSAAAQQAVQNTVAAGFKVWVAQNPAAYGGWNGQALLVEDVANGTASYRLLGDTGADVTAALYPSNGMPWFGQALPFQAGASILPALRNSQATSQTLQNLLNDNGNTTRWQFFAARGEVGDALFLARLAATQDGSACQRITSLVAGLRDGSGGSGGTTIPNSVPVITSIPVTSGSVGQAYRYAVTASDTSGATLKFSLVQAPNTMAMASDGVITWQQPVEGSFAITVRADNGRAYAEQRYLLTIGQQGLPLDISLAVAPAIIDQGQTVQITVLTNGGTAPINTVLQVDGQTVALNANGQATVTGSSIGVHPISVSSTDRLGTISKTSLFSVRNPADGTPPVAIITSPQVDSEITAPVAVSGTASDANLAYYQLLLRPAGSGSWREIARGTQSVTNGVLGKLDPTQLQNGIYELALLVVDVNGQQASQLVALDVYRDLKIGQFSISFQDLNVEASGIPIRVTRTYDTRRKGENLDFGYGWSVDYQSVQIRKNMMLGLQWSVVAHPREFTICLVPEGKRKVNVTLPDGKVERFTAANAQECAFGQVPPVDIRFSPLAGTTSKLEMVNVPEIIAQGGNLYDYADTDNGGIWNQKEFKLTTEDNYVYYLTEGIGIVRVVDPAGNSLTYGQNGIVHSNGLSVAFTRDAANRITAITDPAGKQIQYGYNARGDLTSVTQRNGAASKFNYNRSHGLLDYTDPNGTLAARYVYDDLGRLVAVYDAEGKAVENIHDTDNNREVVKDRRGNSTVFIYDASGNITEKTDALGNKTTYTYDALGNETTTKDALGNVVARTFDAKSGKQLQEKDALGNTNNWAYDAVGTKLKSFQDAKGNTTNYVPLPNGGQSINEPLGRSSTVAVGSNGNPARLTVAGQTTTYAYDGKGNKISETDAAGFATTYTYDANNHEISRMWTRVVNVNGVPTPKTFSISRKLDAEGRVLEETDAAGNVAKSEYNAGGQLLATVDEQGRRTAYAFTPRGKPAKTTWPDGTSESMEYDAENNKTSDIDRQGRVTRYEYDALNRLVKTTWPDGSSSRTEYDALGRVIASVDANGKRVSNQYDAAGRMTAATDAQNNQTRYEYDANGNRTAVVDAQGKRTSYEYDELNRLVKTTWPDSTAVSTVWRLDGRKQSETDARGNLTEYGYSATGQLTQVKQTIGATQQTTSYGFDEVGNKIGQIDAEGRKTAWEYNAQSRVVARILPGNQKETFSYDAVGNLISKTDFNGQVTRYDYNNAGQLIQTTRPNGVTLAQTYAANGQVASVTINGGADSGLQPGKTAYEYDAQDRLTRQTNPDGSFLAWSYDANGNITQRSTAAGTVNYVWDANNRLSSVIDSAQRTTRYTWDAVGRLASTTLPNGVVASNRYDDNGRLLQLLHRKQDGSIVTGVQYTLLPNGQRATMQEFDGQGVVNQDGQASNPLRTSRYTYDSVNRLIQEQILDRAGVVQRTTSYVFDKAGNRTQKAEVTPGGTETTTWRYDSNDRLLEEIKTPVSGPVISTVYGWDNNGNLKSKSGDGQVTLYGWNADNRLIEVRQGSSEVTAQTVARYQYDANGNRIGKTVPGQNGQVAKVTSYLTDTSFPYAQVVQEDVIQGSATESTRYVWGAGLIEQVRGGQGTFYHADGLGSIKALTDQNGNPTDSYQYDAYGNLTAQTGTTTNSYRYTGEYFDEAIALQFNRARWYDVSIGRFVSQDTYAGGSAKPITLNKYLYANADPINKRDPSGKFGLGAGMASISISIGLNLAIDAYSGNLTSPKAFGISVLWGTFQGVAFIGAAAVLAKSISVFGPAIRTALFRQQLARTFALIESGGAAIGKLSSQMVLSTRAGRFLISSGSSAEGGITGALKHVVQDQINKSGLGTAATSEFAEAMVVQELKAVLEVAAESGIIYGEKMLVTTPAGITYEIIIGEATLAGQMGRLYHLLPKY